MVYRIPLISGHLFLLQQGACAIRPSASWPSPTELRVSEPGAALGPARKGTESVFRVTNLDVFVSRVKGCPFMTSQRDKLDTEMKSSSSSRKSQGRIFYLDLATLFRIVMTLRLEGFQRSRPLVGKPAL